MYHHKYLIKQVIVIAFFLLIIIVFNQCDGECNYSPLQGAIGEPPTVVSPIVYTLYEDAKPLTVNVEAKGHLKWYDSDERGLDEPPIPPTNEIGTYHYSVSSEICNIESEKITIEVIVKAKQLFTPNTLKQAFEKIIKKGWNKDLTKKIRADFSPNNKLIRNNHNEDNLSIYSYLKILEINQNQIKITNINIVRNQYDQIVKLQVEDKRI